jgi:uncharacterized protein DUF6570
MDSTSSQCVCASCGEFVLSADICAIENDDSRLHVIGHNNLDCCARHGTSWDICRYCLAALSQSTIPKFSASNRINVTVCQDYPSALEGLTTVEECLIARCHPVGAIFKLRPGGRASPVNYYALRGHMIVIPQDPGPLLDILPSDDLSLQTLIKVCWLGKAIPSMAELKPLLQVRKAKVLAALQFLVMHNPLYKHIRINHSLISTWRDEFVPADIADNITLIPTSDAHEREGYTVRLQKGNHENDFAAAQEAAVDGDIDGPLLTGSVMSDVNGERSHPDTRTLDALLHLVDASPDSGIHVDDVPEVYDHHEDDLTADMDELGNDGQPDSTPEQGLPESQPLEDVQDEHGQPTITYAMQGRAALMSAWFDAHYFTGAFPTLFPYGIGGHLDQRDVPVSIEAFARWCLNHHSKRYVIVQKSYPAHYCLPSDLDRFAIHKTFMYLMYDVIQLRKSSLGYRLLVKRRDWESTMAEMESLTAARLRDAATRLGNGRSIDDPAVLTLLQKLTAIYLRDSDAIYAVFLFSVLVYS